MLLLPFSHKNISFSAPFILIHTSSHEGVKAFTSACEDLNPLVLQAFLAV